MKIVRLRARPLPPQTLPIYAAASLGETFEDRLVVLLGKLHIYGKHATAALHAHAAMEATLRTEFRRPYPVPVAFEELIGLLEADQRGFRGKAKFVRRLREFNVCVQGAPSDWRQFNAEMKPRVKTFLALLRQVLRRFPDSQPTFRGLL